MPLVRLAPPARVLALSVMAAVALTRCSVGGGPSAAPLPAPPPTRATTTTTPRPDLSQVALPTVRGEATTTTVPAGPGAASMEGTVTGPEGAVAGAIVLVERLIAAPPPPTETVTDAEGDWSVPRLAGGRYRVRAWRAPDMAMVQPALIFLGARDTTPVDLKMERYSGVYVAASVSPSQAVVQQPVNLAVQVTQRSVDERGVVRAVPMAGARLNLTGTGIWQAVTSNPTFADGAGRARWELRCAAAGRHPLSVVVNAAESFPVAMPSCSEPAPVVVPTSSPSVATTVVGTGATTRPVTPTTRQPAP